MNKNCINLHKKKKNVKLYVIINKSREGGSMDNNFNNQFNNQNMQNNAGNQDLNTNFQSVNDNMGQPISNTNANNNITNSIKPKKVNAWLIIIPIVVIVAGIVLFTNQEKKEIVNNNDSFIEKNDTNNQEENISGNVEEETNNQEENISGNVEEETNNNYSFLLNVQTVVQVGDRGTIVVGVIEKGTIKEGDVVQIIGNNKEKLDAKVVTLEISSKYVKEANAGDNVGIFLRNITQEQVEIGQQLVK